MRSQSRSCCFLRNFLVLYNVSISSLQIFKLRRTKQGPEANVQVLEVTTGKLVVGGDLDLALTLLLDNNVVAEVVGAALNLDAVLEELLEGGDIEDLVAGRLRSIDDVLHDIS